MRGEPKTETARARITAKELARIVKQAGRLGTTQSDVLRECIRLGLPLVERRK